MENTTTIEVHKGFKAAFRGIPEEKQEDYRRYWHELLFESDDIEDYADDFLAEVNAEAEKGKLTPEKLRSLIARWHEDLQDWRAVEDAKAEGGERTPAEEVFRELGHQW